MFGAEATATEAPAVATGKALSLADISAVGPTHTRSLELVALRLACPPLRHHRWSHSCILFTFHQLINFHHLSFLISTYLFS